MAEITKKRVGQLCIGVFNILLKHPDGIAAHEVLKELEKTVKPTDFEKADYPNNPGIRRFERIVRFSTVNLTKAGWMTKVKGYWYITKEGKAAHKQFKDPELFAKEAARLYKRWKLDQTSEDESEEEVESETGGLSVEEAEEAARLQIEAYIKVLPPYDVQRLVAALLRAMAYHISWVAPHGPDGGVDIIAHSDPLGATSPRIKTQVKRQIASVSAGELRSFMSLIGPQDIGIFVSTGGFTKEAQSEARAKDTRITLIDLKRLVELWIEHYQKIEESDRKLLPLRSVYYLAHEE